MPLPLDPAQKLAPLSNGFALAHGPVFSRSGYLLFSDVRHQRIHKWEQGQLTIFREPSHRANGLTFDHQGRLLTAEAAGRLTRTEKNGSLTVLAEKGLQAPHDVVYAIDGSIYFTDPPAHRFYQLTRQGQLRPVAEAPHARALALSPNQQHLYLAAGPRVQRHAIAPDGRLDPGQPYAPLAVEGLKTDEDGNVWMATPQGLAAHNLHGETLGLLPTPEPPTNCAFSGATLYLTTPSAVHRIATRVFGTRTF
ncbi:MAG: SMP-30/gluconolactonase/LRE family protein [bacterium]